MTTQHASDSSKPAPTATKQSARIGGWLIGASIGAGAGGLVGWLIDSALTSDPYAGVRIGGPVGGMCGGVVGLGAGWKGIGMVLLLVLCSAGGAALALALWSPAPDDFVSLIPSFVGGILGAFVGLVLGVALVRRRQPDAAARHSDSTG